MTIWLKTVSFEDGTRETTDEDGVKFMQALAMGVRICKDDVIRIHPWHRIRIVTEEDDE